MYMGNTVGADAALRKTFFLFYTIIPALYVTWT
jgi:hypothetical protein